MAQQIKDPLFRRMGNRADHEPENFRMPWVQQKKKKKKKKSKDKKNAYNINAGLKCIHNT